MALKSEALLGSDFLEYCVLFYLRDYWLLDNACLTFLTAIFCHLVPYYIVTTVTGLSIEPSAIVSQVTFLPPLEVDSTQPKKQASNKGIRLVLFTSTLPSTWYHTTLLLLLRDYQLSHRRLCHKWRFYHHWKSIRRIPKSKQASNKGVRYFLPVLYLVPSIVTTFTGLSIEQKAIVSQVTSHKLRFYHHWKAGHYSYHLVGELVLFCNNNIVIDC